MGSLLSEQLGFLSVDGVAQSFVQKLLERVPRVARGAVPRLTAAGADSGKSDGGAAKHAHKRRSRFRPLGLGIGVMRIAIFFSPFLSWAVVQVLAA
jgi:hypothetical protein